MAHTVRTETFLDTGCSHILEDIATAVAGLTLGDLGNSEATVYDFWTTRCTNCPAALDCLDMISCERPSVKFVAVNIDDLLKARELVKQAASAGRWTRLTHLHLEEEAKESVKDILGMRTVPFYVVVSKEGRILAYGNAKVLPLKSVESLDAVLLRKDEAPLASPMVPTPAHSAPSASSAPECEGGICRLPKDGKSQPSAAEEPAPTGAKTGNGTAIAGTMAALTLSTTADIGSPGTDPNVAQASRAGMECEGGICKLIRRREETPVKVNGASENKSGATTSNPVAGSVSVAPGTMECEGSVCKLVRGTKPSAARVDTASEGINRKGEGGGGVPLGLGGAMLSLQVVTIGDGSMVTKTLDEMRAGRPAVVAFWKMPLGSPGPIQALENLAASAAKRDGPADGETRGRDRYIYISVNLDNLEEAKSVVTQGLWASVKHAFAGQEEESERLESFKARAGLKSLPFYAVVDADGRIEQIGGPEVVDLSKTAPPSASPQHALSDNTAAAINGLSGTSKTGASSAPPEPASKPFVFTMDEDF